MMMLADIWGDWASQETVRKTFKTCGVTTDGLDVELMQADKFAAANSVTQEEEETASPKTPANQKPAWEAPSPVNIKKGSRAYFKMKYESMSKKYKETLESPITPEDIPAFSKVEKFKPKKSKNIRITQVTGSLEAKDVYKKRLEMEAVEEDKKQKLQDKKDKKDQERKTFLRCKDACCCEGERCKAANLKQCSVCESVIKSQCTKAQCKLIASGKPKMLVAGGETIRKDAKKTTKGKSRKFEEIYGSDLSESESDFAEDFDTSADEQDDDDSPSDQIKEFWKSVSPPTPEMKIKGIWFSAVYTEAGASPLLSIGRAKHRFLDEEGGRVTHITLDCLKPRIGT